MKQAWIVLFTLLSASASATTILVAIQQWYPHATSDGKVAILVLAGYVSVITAATVFQEYRYARKARYAEALPYINRIFLEIEGVQLNAHASADEIERVLNIVVNQLAAAYSLVSGTKCSACVKNIENDPDTPVGSQIRPVVNTLCRDDSSPKRWISSDVQHWLDQNTDFHTLHERAGTPEGTYFFENYLPLLRDYQNTSFHIYKSRNPWNTNLPIVADVFRNAFWPLPYRSTIVVPIQPRPTPRERNRLIGYLCVDSRSLGAFRLRHDVELMTGVADCLYGVVRRYWQIARQ
jgi:hypothetical protein